jgi:hypothetical protein
MFMNARRKSTRTCELGGGGGDVNAGSVKQLYMEGSGQ